MNRKTGKWEKQACPSDTGKTRPPGDISLFLSHIDHCILSSTEIYKCAGHSCDFENLWPPQILWLCDSCSSCPSSLTLLIKQYLQFSLQELDQIAWCSLNINCSWKTLIKAPKSNTVLSAAKAWAESSGTWDRKTVHKKLNKKLIHSR